MQLIVVFAAVLAVAFAAPSAKPGVVAAYSAPVVAASPVVASYSAYAAPAVAYSGYAAAPVVSAAGVYPYSYGSYYY